MRSPSVRYNLAAVVVMTIGVALLVLKHFGFGISLFALGSIFAILAGRCAALEAGRAVPGRVGATRDADATAEDAETHNGETHNGETHNGEGPTEPRR